MNVCGDRGRLRGGPDAAGSDEMNALFWRAVVAFRIATLMYAGVLLVRAHQTYANPRAGLIVLAIMVGWTVAMTAANLTTAGRRWPVVAVDLAVCAALTLATAGVQTYAQSHGEYATLTTTWSASPVLACAVIAGPWSGALGAALIAAASLLVRGTVTVTTFNSIVLLFLAGVVSGYTVRLALTAQRELAAAHLIEAAARERDRLARTIHDGVLQVLALMQRRGSDMGGDAAELARLAGEQEAALRVLVQAQPPTDHAHDHGSGVDLRALLMARTSASVTVAVPASGVLLPDHAAREMDAAVGAALDNVARHAGRPDTAAQAWVLLEEIGDRIVVTVRDDGVGIEPGRLTQAAAAGRLGVASSIRRRVEELGGQVRIVSEIGEGTEIELEIGRQR